MANVLGKLTPEELAGAKSRVSEARVLALAAKVRSTDLPVLLSNAMQQAQEQEREQVRLLMQAQAQVQEQPQPQPQKQSNWNPALENAKIYSIANRLRQLAVSRFSGRVIINFHRGSISRKIYKENRIKIEIDGSDSNLGND